MQTEFSHSVAAERKIRLYICVCSLTHGSRRLDEIELCEITGNLSIVRGSS